MKAEFLLLNGDRFAWVFGLAKNANDILVKANPKVNLPETQWFTAPLFYDFLMTSYKML